MSDTAFIDNIRLAKVVLIIILNKSNIHICNYKCSIFGILDPICILKVAFVFRDAVLLKPDL